MQQDLSFGRILVRATNWVGDAVMCVPALQALRGRYPSAHIAVLARPWVADIYRRENFVSEVIPYSPKPGFHDLRAKFAVAQNLRARKFDCAILFQNAFEAAFVCWLAGIPKRVGYARDARGLLLTTSVRPPRRGEIPRHERFYYLELLRRAGVLEKLPDSPEIRLGAAAEARKTGQRMLQTAGITMPVVGIAPGAAYGSAKRWLPERFAAAAVDVARSCKGTIAIFGSAAERDVAQQVAATVRTAGIPTVNYAGSTSLAEFIDLTAACQVFLTNDSGPMHIASALGVPTVAIFGATDHVGTGPTGDLARVVKQPVECSPCLLRECPIDHRCMTSVPASRVADVALDLISLRPFPGVLK